MDGVPVNLITQKTADKDELFVCPYDSVHRISAMRWVPHIMKCSRNFPHIRLVKCPFNAKHMFSEPDMRYHISICPDKRAVEREQQSQGELTSTTEHPTSYSSEPLPFSDDDSWDEEISQNNRRDTRKDFRNHLLHEVRSSHSRVADVSRMKAAIREEQLRASKAQELPSRRPFGTGPRVNNVVGAIGNTPTGASDEGTSAKTRPRLAANFSITPDKPEMRGRGRHLFEPGACGRGRGISTALHQSHFNTLSSVVPQLQDVLDDDLYGEH